ALRFAGGQAGDHLGPVGAVVAGAVDVRQVVAHVAVVHLGVGFGGVGVAGDDEVKLGAGGGAGRRDFLPVRAQVAGQPQQAGVGAGPDQAAGDGRGQERGQRRSGASVGGRDRRLAVMGREVGADVGPMLAAVVGHAHVLRAKEHHMLILRQKGDGWIGELPVGLAVAARTDVLVGPKRARHLDQQALQTSDINDVVVERVGRSRAGLAGRHGVPVEGSDFTQVAAAGHRHRAAVLLGGIDPVWVLVTSGNTVDLRGGLVVPGRPGGAVVEADGCALIHAEDHAAAVGRVNPEFVVVVAAGSALEGSEGVAAIGGAIG